MRRPATVDAALVILVVTHAFIVYSALDSGWRLQTVAWLYWCGNFFVGATVFWRMIHSSRMDLSELIAYFIGFGMVQAYAAGFTYAGTGTLRWDPEIGLALLGIFASQFLEMRAARAIDHDNPPQLEHFALLGVARVIPLALMVAFALAFGDWIAHNPVTYLMVFLLAVAAVDVAMQVWGRSIGRASSWA